MNNKKVILVTGASSGMGYNTAKILAEQGNIVYGGARRLSKMDDLKKFGVHPIKLDVNDEYICKNAIKHIINNNQRIDVLINNAGYGSYGSIEDVSIKEAKNQMEVNVFGLARLIQIVLPYMRKQQSGQIINTSSMGGKFVTYFGGWYHASKYAVEALSDALRMETKPFNIKVSIIEPGLIRTNWGHIAADNLAKTSKNSPYKNMAIESANSLHKTYNSKMLSSPEKISKVIVKSVNSKHPKSRYLVGFAAKPLVFLHLILPTKIFDKLMTHF